MTRLRTHSLVPCFLFLASACGGTTSSPDAGNGGGNDTGGGASPLVGSWFQQVTPVTMDDQTITITFAADGSVTFVHTQLDAPASGPTSQCTETCTTPGTYTSTATSVTMTPNTSGASQVNSNCSDPAQNGTVTATSCSSLAATFDWVIAADTLTLTDPSNPTNMIVLTRH